MVLEEEEDLVELSHAILESVFVLVVFVVEVKMQSEWKEKNP